MCAAGDATASVPVPERSQFERFTELLTTLFPVWVRPALTLVQGGNATVSKAARPAQHKLVRPHLCELGSRMRKCLCRG